MSDRPLCECHGVPMHRRADRKVGWRCAVARVAAVKKYDRSEKGSAWKKRANARRIRVGSGHVVTLRATEEEHVPRLKRMIAEFQQKQAEERKQHVIES